MNIEVKNDTIGELCKKYVPDAIKAIIVFSKDLEVSEDVRFRASEFLKVCEQKGLID